MSVPESKIIAAVEHYQNSITKHENNKEKILYCIQKLSKFPMTVSILQKTLVGLTINALRKYEGDVGNAAKVLVTKWKDVVRKESKEDHPEEEIDEEEEDVNNHENNHSNDSGVDNDDLEDMEEEYAPKMRDKKIDENLTSSKHADSKSKKDILTNGKGERHSSSKRSKYSDDRSNRSGHDTSSGKKLNHESLSNKKLSHESLSKQKVHDEGSVNGKSSHRSSSSSKSKSESRKRKHEMSESDSNHNSSDSSDESNRSIKRPRTIKVEKQSSDERGSGSESDASGSESSNNSRADVSKHSNHKHEKSSGKVSKSSHHSSSSSKSKNDSSHKKLDSHKKSSRDETKSSHSSSKTSHSKSERHKDKNEQKYSSKEKHSRNNDHHKSKSSKAEPIKIKVEKDDSKSSKSEKESLKAQSPVKVKQEKDKISVNSFEAALMGFSSPADQGKVKVKPKSSSKVSTPSSDSKRSPDSTVSKSSKSPGASPEFDLFPEVKTDLDKDIASSLPELADVYRPLPHLSESKRDKVKLLSEDEALASIMTTKNQRTKVYSGNKSLYTKVPSLFDLCTRVLIDNIDLLEYTGGVPYDILKPVIERANADQLFTLEYHNEYLKDDTDVHWKYHCQKDFKGKTKEESETWRELYLRCMDERQQKLERLTNNITRSIAESAPARKTKLAYVDSAVKPPRNVIRKQSKNGTAVNSAPSSSKYDIIAKSVKGESSSTKSSETAVKVASPAMQKAANYVNNFVKKKKAPLMQKTLQLIKGNRFKR